jgi:hypothetical protein
MRQSLNFLNIRSNIGSPVRGARRQGARRQRESLAVFRSCLGRARCWGLLNPRHTSYIARHE